VRVHVAALAALTLVATACSRGGVDDRAFAWTEELPAGATVHLRNGTGEISVRPASGQNFVVNGSRAWRHGRANDVKFVVTHTGNDYFVCAMWRNSGTCGAKGYRGKNTGGLLAMFSLFHRTTDATAGLDATVPANVTVDAKTGNGSVSVDGVAAGVTAHTANGDVVATHVSGPLSLVSTNGNVRLSADTINGSDSINLSTKNGIIRAQLPPNTEGKFDLSVVNGTVQSDIPLTQMAKARFGRRLEGQVGSSNRIVRMHTLNGAVFVTTHGTSVEHE